MQEQLEEHMAEGMWRDDVLAQETKTATRKVREKVRGKCNDLSF
jgi:hypothetical protein